MDNIAVLIPCYNEAQTIRKVVTDWKRGLSYNNDRSDET